MPVKEDTNAHTDLGQNSGTATQIAEWIALFSAKWRCLTERLSALLQSKHRHCFILHEDYVHLLYEQSVTCMLGGAGLYPPQSRKLNDEDRCCFDIPPGRYQFWAYGQQISSGIQDFEIGKDDYTHFSMQTGGAADILIIDAKTQEPIPGAIVSLADESVHLLSINKRTDHDGYAVFPVGYGQKYIVSARASYYLSSFAKEILIPYDEDLLTQAFVITLDRGVQLRGTVLNPKAQALDGAQLILTVRSPDNALWSSTLDLPKPMHLTFQLRKPQTWFPQRPNFSTQNNGLFSLWAIPRGKIRLYATHPDFAPSAPLLLDDAHDDSYQNLSLTLRPPFPLLLRCTNQHGGPTSCFVRTKAQDLDDWSPIQETQSSGFIHLQKLPQLCDLEISGPNIVTQTLSLDLSKTTEYEVSTQNLAPSISGSILHRGAGVDNAIISANASQYVQCIGKTDSSGSFTLTSCPPTPFWAEIRADNLAPAWALIDDENRHHTFHLPKPATLLFAFTNEDTNEEIPAANCELQTTFSSNNQIKTHTEILNLLAPMLPKNAMPPQSYTIQCTSLGFAPATAEFSLQEGQTKTLPLHFAPLFLLEGYTIDSYSSIVPNARIVYRNGVVYSDSQGHYQLEANPHEAISLQAYHWLYGQGSLQLSPDTVQRLNNIRLDHKLNSLCADFLQKHSTTLLQEAASTQIEDLQHSTLPFKENLKRGDYLESCECKNDQCTKFVFVRENSRFVLSP